MYEVKVVRYPVNQACLKIYQSANSLQSSFSSRIEGDTRMEAAEQLNKINASLSSMLALYQSMLSEHIEATRKTVQTMEDADVEIGLGIFNGFK